jgi:hypothetical protein
MPLSGIMNPSGDAEPVSVREGRWITTNGNGGWMIILIPWKNH